MPILTFSLANGSVNDADEVMTLFEEIEAVLDGGIQPANLASGFTLDAQTQLTNNNQEIQIPLKFSLASAALTTVLKDFGAIISGSYTVIGAYANYTLTNGTGAPSGSPDRVTFTVKAGAYVTGSFVTAATVLSTTTIYAAQTESVSEDLTANLSTVNLSGPKTLVLSIDGVPASNPPTSGFFTLTLVLKRLLQA
jgi:hypothetical protein